MKFVAVSDTHDNIVAIQELIEELKGEKFEFVVHAGDVIAPFALREFEKLDRMIYIAFGNNDGDRNLLMNVVEKNGWIAADVVSFPVGAVYHGTDKNVIDTLKKLNTNFLILGHTHKPKVEKLDSLTVLNPGEVCGYLTGKRTYAVIEDGEVSIIDF